MDTILDTMQVQNMTNKSKMQFCNSLDMLKNNIDEIVQQILSKNDPDIICRYHLTIDTNNRKNIIPASIHNFITINCDNKINDLDEYIYIDEEVYHFNDINMIQKYMNHEHIINGEHFFRIYI